MKPRPKPINNLVKQTQLAINVEYSAIKCYEKLAKLAPTDEEQKQIMKIRNDEINHLKELVILYTGISGIDPKPKQTEPCEDDYLRGLETALKDEKHTVDFYLTVAEGTINKAARELFTRAARDEHKHAVWFYYFYMKNK